MQIKRCGSQPSGAGPAEYFTGRVRIDPMTAAPDPAPFSCASVTFEPGARTAWHTHPLGQALIASRGLNALTAMIATGTSQQTLITSARVWNSFAVVALPAVISQPPCCALRYGAWGGPARSLDYPPRCALRDERFGAATRAHASVSRRTRSTRR